MTCVLCDKNCQLGITNFENEFAPAEDPLSLFFENEMVSFQNPETKQSEKRPIFDVIDSQIKAENFTESNLRMFPPVITPPQNFPHGFPQHFPETCMDFDNKKTKPIENGKIEDKDAYKAGWFQTLLEHQAESAVSLAFQSFFSDRRGFISQNYHPETYLQPLVDKAKKQREDLVHRKQIERNQLSTLQEKVCQAISSVGPHNKETYTHELGDRNRETDNIIVLEKEKLFLVLETKSRVKDQEKMMNTLKPAARNQMKRKQYFMGNHQDILDKDWRFVSLVVLPFLENKAEVLGNQVCEQCLNFVLEKNDILHLESSINKILYLVNFAKREQEFDVEKSYINLYKRLIGFMSLSTNFGFSSNVFMDQKDAAVFVEETILG